MEIINGQEYCIGGGKCMGRFLQAIQLLSLLLGLVNQKHIYWHRSVTNGDKFHLITNRLISFLWRVASLSIICDDDDGERVCVCVMYINVINAVWPKYKVLLYSDKSILYSLCV